MGSPLLYLDTARLGRMTAQARQAQVGFAKLASDEGASPLFERLLRYGVEAVPAAVRCRYPGLSAWRGVTELKASLRQLAGGRRDLPVLLANRSAQLMKLAARTLFSTCRNVLVTDLGWPAYHEILQAECRRVGRSVTTVALRDAILRGRMAEEEAVELARSVFLGEGCDGLFLTAVSNLGVRLPVERIVRTLSAERAARFVVVDGAQDFCHASASLRNEYCDLYLAGCHKWLGAYHPMGLAFYGRRRSRSFIETLLAHVLSTGELDDPLLRFSSQLEEDALDGTTETVDLASLFSCQGAVVDALAVPRGPVASLPGRLENLSVAADFAASCGWRPLLPRPEFQTGILLLEAERSRTKGASAEVVRSAFYDRGVALTAYGEGLIRLSMPDAGWQSGEAEHLRAALRSVA